MKCKPYSEITVESGTKLKTVHICSVLDNSSVADLVLDQNLLPPKSSLVCPLINLSFIGSPIF